MNMKNKFKKFIPFLFLFLMLIGLMGCSKKTNLKHNNKSDISTMKGIESPSEIEALNLPNEIQTSLSVVHDIEKLKSEGTATIVRYNNDKFYSVARVEDGKYLFLLYDENEGSYQVVDGFLVSNLADQSLFEDISQGMKREEILKNDPSSRVIENRSYHRFSDKAILRVDYVLENDQYIVSEFQILENQVSVLDYLISEDLDEIL